MSEEPSNVWAEWRDVRGWVPWLLAGVYFPLYVTLDFFAGRSVATAFGVPRSVSVALFSLLIALVVTAAAVTAWKFENVELSRAVAAVDPRTSGRHRSRSTVGASGAVNRRTIESSPRSARSDGFDGDREGGDDVSGTNVDDGPAADDDSERSESDGVDETDWPEEWIPGDQV